MHRPLRVNMEHNLYDNDTDDYYDDDSDTLIMDFFGYLR